MINIRKTKISKLLAITLLGSSLMLTSCGGSIDQHGYVAHIGAIEDIIVGMPISEVNSILGSPSVVTTANGLSHYYISSKKDRYNLFGPKEKERQVLAVHFGSNKRVTKIANYGLKDGVVFDFVSQTTPTYKKDLNILQELFGGVGAGGVGDAASTLFSSGNF